MLEYTLGRFQIFVSYIVNGNDLRIDLYLCHIAWINIIIKYAEASLFPPLNKDIPGVLFCKTIKGLK